MHPQLHVEDIKKKPTPLLLPSPPPALPKQPESVFRVQVPVWHAVYGLLSIPSSSKDTSACLKDYRLMPQKHLTLMFD